MIVDIDALQYGKVGGISVRVYGTTIFTFLAVGDEALMWPRIDPSNGEMLWRTLGGLLDSASDRSG